MGLDNGLVCKNFPRTGTKERNYEFCYWRKFWDFRNEVIDYLCDRDESDAYFLQLPQLEDVREIMAKYTDLKYVKEHNIQTIWNDSDVVEIMRNNLKSLDEFLEIMRESPGFIVYFYDSY